MEPSNYLIKLELILDFMEKTLGLAECAEILMVLSENMDLKFAEDVSEKEHLYLDLLKLSKYNYFNLFCS